MELIGPSGEVVDSREQFFNSLEPGKRSYLKLITFYTKPIGEATEEKFRVLNESAYAGGAIPLVGGYDTDPVPTFESFQPQAAMLRRVLTIDPWPWGSVNRFIGARPDGGGHASAHAKRPEYFFRVNGLDLDGRAGNRGDMSALWRHAVRLAKTWNSPGVMIDLEAYNNYRAYDTAWVASERGDSIEAMIVQCEKAGEDLARIIEEEYPRCVVCMALPRASSNRATGSRNSRRSKISSPCSRRYSTPTTTSGSTPPARPRLCPTTPSTAVDTAGRSAKRSMHRQRPFGVLLTRTLDGGVTLGQLATFSDIPPQADDAVHAGVVQPQPP